MSALPRAAWFELEASLTTALQLARGAFLAGEDARAILADAYPALDELARLVGVPAGALPTVAPDVRRPRPCRDCGEPIVFLRRESFVPVDAAAAGGAVEFDASRHKFHRDTCTKTPNEAAPVVERPTGAASFFDHT